MVKRYTKNIFLLVLLNSVICSLGFGTPKSSISLPINQHTSVFDNIDTENFSKVVLDKYHDPFSAPFSYLFEEEIKEEEDSDSKDKFIENYSSYEEQSIHPINAPPVKAVPLSILEFYHSTLYILFEVFRL